MARYMLFIAGDEKAQPQTAEAMGKMMEDYGAYSGAMAAAGIMRAGDALEPASSATSVRVRDGKTLTTDGPFAETKETVGGYYVIDVDNLDRAIEWAARCPAAHTGVMEVRPVLELPAEYAQNTGNAHAHI